MALGMSFIPHPIPYQGSKRRLAPLILSYVSHGANRLIEPFVGSGAVTLAAATRGLAQSYVLGDSLEPLAHLWRLIIEAPNNISTMYQNIWEAQFPSPRDHYLKVRAEYNKTKSPSLLLYLMARCVKNAIRFNPAGEFNQSADHRRHGMNPEKMRLNISGASRLLAKRSEVFASDYTILLDDATRNDIVYMDPPYQGVSGTKDRRYYQQINLDSFLAQIDALNGRDVPFLLSFDGFLGEKKYGKTIPDELGLKQIFIRAGRSSQSTLSGRSDETVESLYLSPSLASAFHDTSLFLSISRKRDQLGLNYQSVQSFP